MKHFARSLVIAPLAALLLTSCGSIGRGGETLAGMDDQSIKLGISSPQTGPGSSYGVIARAMDAYYKVVNESGGVEFSDGVSRKITTVTYDDAYTPDKAAANVRRLVEDDDVFLVHGIVGTGTNVAVRDYLNEKEIPQVLADSPSSRWGDVEKHPWTRGWQPSFQIEAALFADYLQKEVPGAKVAVLYQNDAYGAEYVESFKRAIEGTELEIVAQEPYQVTDATVANQMSNLAASKANAFLNVSTSKAAAQSIRAKADLGWDAVQFINNISASKAAVLAPAGLDNAKGVLSASYLPDPSDGSLTGEAFDTYVKAVKAAGLNADDPNVVHGWVMGEIMVHVLETMQGLTRADYLAAYDSIDGFVPSLSLDGISLRTGDGDPFMIETMKVVEFDGDAWVGIGEPVSFEGQSEVIQ